MALDVDPAQIQFGTVPSGRGAVRSVALTGPDAGHTKLLSATIDRASPAREPEATPLLEAHAVEGPPGSVEVSLAPDAPSGRFYALITLHTDHPLVPSLQLRVLGEVGSAVRLRPERLLFRNNGQEGEQTRTISVRGAGPESVSVLGVESNDPRLRTTYAAQPNGRTKVDVTFDGHPQADHETAVVVIRTSSPDQPRIEVPVEIVRTAPPAASPAPQTH